MDDNGFKITLKNKNKEKTFVVAPTGRMVREAAELKEKLNHETLTPKTMDSMVDFVVKLFQNQFTSDDLYDGTDAGLLGKACLGYMDDVITRFYLKGNKLPNAETGKPN